MKTLVILWKRLTSADTPAILRRVRNSMLAISAITGSLSISLLAFDSTKKIAVTCGIIAAVTSALALGLAGGTQLSTNSTSIQKLSDPETGLPK